MLVVVGCWCPRGTRLVRIPYRGYSHSDAVITASKKMNPRVSAIRISVSFFIGSISVEHFFDEAVCLGFGLWRAGHAAVEKQIELLSSWRNLAPAWRICCCIHGYYMIAVRIADMTSRIAKTASPPTA